MSAVTPDETILGLLAFRRQHGYELMEFFRAPDALGEVWNLSTSQLYAVLKRLEAQGFIKGKTLVSENAPARVEYTLTDAGKTRLSAWLAESHPSASIRRVRVEFLSRLYIARLLNHPTQPLVKAQKAMCRKQQEELMSHLNTLPPGIGRLTVEFVIAQLDAVLNWIDRCEMIPHFPEE
jgi:DNA-binding PadR family transcriptional regulator